MDSLTHIVLGACTGELIAGKKIGKKAMLIGAVAQSLPDIDFVASFWMNTADELIAHRGITHSIVFIVIVSFLLAALSKRTVSTELPLSKWFFFYLIEMSMHLFIDAFNNYGVGWFEPFAHTRISFNTIYVADPLITIFPLFVTIVLLILRGRNPSRTKWSKSALLLSFFYLLICTFNKMSIDREAQLAFAKQHIPHQTYFTTPAPLQSILWMVVAGDRQGFYVGFRSLFDRSPEISFQYFPRNELLLAPIANDPEVVSLKRFSQGFYTVEKWSDTLVFNDLRFGQKLGWANPKEQFVFHYFLHQPEGNDLVVQRGRFAGWNAQVARTFLRRIMGNK